MTDRINLDVQNGYDRWARIYDEEQNPLVMLEEPLVRQWLQLPAGSRVADVGCGTGRHSLWLAGAGLAVDAFDCSAGMMAKARAKLSESGVRFNEHQLPAPLPVEDDTFDAALLALVADHLEELEATFRELRRIVKPGGMVVFTVLHPAMNLLGLTARFTDPDSGREVRVAAYEHTFGDYVMAALRSGLQVDEIYEGKVDEELIARTQRAEKYAGWPLLLGMRLSK